MPIRGPDWAPIDRLIRDMSDLPLIATEQRTSRDVSNVSRSGGRCERVIRIAGIHKIGTGVAQQSFDLLDRSPNYTARLPGLNLALQLKEAPIGAVDALRQDRCNVKERDRVYPEYGGRIGDVKLRGFQSTYIRRVRLIEKHGEFAEHGTGLRDPGNLDAFLYDCYRALLKDQQPAGCRGGPEHGLAGLVGC